MKGAGKIQTGSKYIPFCVGAFCVRYSCLSRFSVLFVRRQNASITRRTRGVNFIVHTLLYYCVDDYERNTAGHEFKYTAAAAAEPVFVFYSHTYAVRLCACVWVFDTGLTAVARAPKRFLFSFFFYRPNRVNTADVIYYFVDSLLSVTALSSYLLLD